MVRKATGNRITPPQFGTSLGPAAQITRYVKAELEVDDKQRKRMELPVDGELFRPLTSIVISCLNVSETS